jgi:uncharacterized protein (UPF0335 family)
MTGENRPTEESYIDAAVELEREIATLKESLRDTFADAKEHGYAPADIKAMKAVVKEVLRTPEQRAAKDEAERALVDLFGRLSKSKYGMIRDD